MTVEFASLPETSKIWIYQSSRKFYPEELKEILKSLNSFLNSWIDKDNDFQVSFKIIYDRFIIIALDNKGSTISIETIDKSVGLILQFESKYEITLLDKLNVCFKQGEFVQYKDLKDFRKLIKKKSISAKTIVFNNLIDTKGELDHNWEIPLSESWHNRFL